MVKHVFKNRDGKNVDINTAQNHKKGKLTFSDKKIDNGLFGGPVGALDSSCACPLCTGIAPARTPACECPLCVPVLGGGIGGPSGDTSLGRMLGMGGDPFSSGGGGSSLSDPRMPRTIEDLMTLLRVHKPGKKIIEVAGDIDIVETKVTMLQLEPGVMGPGVLDWAVGPAAAGQQRLMLKITRKVHIHVHFVLKVAVPTF
ncbi:hypothetical protein BMF94_5768 [Rhodotorula taiwanensis]|uniref:Uncharacterized protein n=1 Tax=Rhodotorula taiwanensis TaxID=741276 RepID=A0A2S5B3Y8_9BASI|nr:hypothetical protein BMF94_5768 [Rhodotorula taiwanensis]